MASPCFSCGRALAEKEKGAVRLKDGNSVCRDCANETRILYPLRYEKVLTQSEHATWINDKAFHDAVILGRRIDPLSEMTSEEFRTALNESRKAAEAQAVLYAGVKAVIEADHVRKYFFNAGTEQKPKYTKRKVYGVFGKVVHGKLFSGAEVAVSHRDRDYAAKIEELQDWDGTSPGGEPVANASAGKLVNMVFTQDMSFVYPGDTLVVR